MRIFLNILIGALLVVAGWAWIMLPWSTRVSIALWPGGEAARVSVPATILPLIGVAILLALLLARIVWEAYRFGYVEDMFPLPPTGIPVTLSIAVSAFAILLFVAVDREALEPGRAALLFLCGTITLLAAAYTLGALRIGDAVEVSSHWGGLGGAIGGWRISPVTTLLLLVLIFLGATVAVGGGLGGGETNDQSTNEAGANQSTANATGANQSTATGGNSAAGDTVAGAPSNGVNGDAANGVAGVR